MNSTVYNRKNKYILLIVAIILLIPAVLAAYFALHTDTGTVSAKRVTQITVLSPQGIAETLSDKADFDLYTAAIEGARLIDENFRDLSADIPYTVTFSETDDISVQYSFYMINASDGCIYTDAEGKYYLFSEKDAKALLARDEFATVNTFAVVPYAAISKENAEPVLLAPSGGTWNYLGADGNYLAKAIADSGERKTVTISLSSLGTLSFYSEAAPDHVSVTLSKDGVVKHEGAYENLLNGDVMSANDTYYDLVINAEWAQKEDASSSYYGSVTYTARVLYDVAPSYTVIYNGVVSKGDFTILKIQNFNDGDKLYASCAYPFPTELQVFRSDAGYSYAFLPAEYSSVAAGTYDLVLSLADGTSQTVKVSVRDGRNPTTYQQDLLLSDTTLQSAFTSEAFEELETVIAEKTATSNPMPLWDGKFVYPDGDNKGTVGTGMAQYGTNRRVRGLYQTEYVHTGMDIAMNTGDNVYAANNGKVVFAGTLTLTGNTVIIDHGCSVFSYYCHLSELNVAEGDSVSKSGVIGKAGSTGFAVKANGAVYEAASQVHFAASVDGVFVNPYYLWKSGVVFND